ncbi:hypothetical protein ACJX0J_010737, partial [Zea mays]
MKMCIVLELITFAVVDLHICRRPVEEDHSHRDQSRMVGEVFPIDGFQENNCLGHTSKTNMVPRSFALLMIDCLFKIYDLRIIIFSFSILFYLLKQTGAIVPAISSKKNRVQSRAHISTCINDIREMFGLVRDIIDKL